MLETPQNETENTILVQPQEVPNYWPLYGLNQSPFEESFQSEFYYSMPQWQQVLEHFKELSASSHRLTLVTGALCCGKSTIISQFIASNPCEPPTYVLKSHVAIHVTDLLNTIRNYLGFTCDHDPNTDQFKDLLTLLQQQQKHHVLFIDDAHRLPLESLSALIQLTLAQESESVYLHIVLLGEPQLANRIKNLLEILAQPTEFPQFNLRSLNLEETKNYIQYRLHKAGLNPSIPLNETVLTRIYRLSGGLPGKINRVAQQYLSDILPKNQILLSATQTNSKSSQPHTFNKFLTRLMGITLTLGILGLVACYFYAIVLSNPVPKKALIIIPSPKDPPSNQMSSAPVPPLEPVAQGEMTISPILSTRGGQILTLDKNIS